MIVPAGAPRSRTRAVAVGALVCCAATLPAVATGCGPSAISARAPTLARETPRPLDPPLVLSSLRLDSAPSKSPIVSTPALSPPDPSDALATGIRTELAARRFEIPTEQKASASERYAVDCRLTRFALRRDKDEEHVLMVLYVDLACDAHRRDANAGPLPGSTAASPPAIWRGALRGRVATSGAKAEFGDEDLVDQRLADRLMSDATRELASDLAIRVFSLRGRGSRRIFSNDEAERTGAGLLDTELGALATSEDPATARLAAARLRDPDAKVRRAAWNVVAMAASPDGDWLGGTETVREHDTVARFYEYKALARHASEGTLRELKVALGRDKSTLLKEFLEDIKASGGLPLTPWHPPSRAPFVARDPLPEPGGEGPWETSPPTR